MPALFRRQSNIQCFFCQSSVPLPLNAHNFKCPSCSCWNRYDDNGEIISDEPAMHEERLNSRSFLKRAAPRNDRIPTTYGPGPFCHSCQTNQMLIINLLSNYLPDPESSEYQNRLEMLSEYRESLHRRYPPVCGSCLPQVEEALRNKEQMARTQALGGYLSKGKDRQRRVSGTQNEKIEIVSETLFWWKVRGALWGATLCFSLITTVSAAYDFYPFQHLSFVYPVLPLLLALSLLWTAWDPTYARFQKAQRQGRDVRIHGKELYNRFQILAWSIRLLSSMIVSIRWFKPDLSPSRDEHRTSKIRIYLFIAAFLEIFSTILSFYFLRIQQPPTIRLVDTQAHAYDRSRSGTPIPEGRVSSSTPTAMRFPTIPDADALLALSLSSKPIITHLNPVFGLPSFPHSTPASTSLASTSLMEISPKSKDKSNDADEMDWSPTNPAMSSESRQKESTESSYGWLRPQRFFAPEKPTGLEGLFENTRIQDEPMPYQGSSYHMQSDKRRLTNYLWEWRLSLTLSFGIFVAFVAYILKWLGLINWAST